MTREELKVHCKKEIENCEIWAAYKGQEPHGKIYEEHKLILELLDQETVSKEVYDHEYFLRKEFELKIDKLQRQLKEQEQSKDMKEIEEVINCDANAETKCKMISNILTAKSHYFEEPQESEEQNT